MGNKKVLFTSGPSDIDAEQMTNAIINGVSMEYTYHSVEAMKAHWIGTNEGWVTNRIYRITIEEVEKDGLPKDADRGKMYV